MSEPLFAPPYVGPRSFDERDRDRFFGRERDVVELFHLLVGKRLVLLYSPSGAGKSSLIRAALVPRLRAQDFFVYPPIRVGAQVAAPASNRFVSATIQALEEALDPAERLDPAQRETLDLATYAARRPPRAGGEVYLFDQFEELLTVDPAVQEPKLAFFEQLGGLLEHPRRWALFAIREEHLGPLRPLLRNFPTRLAATYRLSLLETATARRAVQEPARNAGVVFSDEAADRLLDDLRRVFEQRPDGSTEPVLGPYVEPVQLQVVCLQLWNRLFGQAPPPTGATIEVAELQNIGNVTTALATYYEERVRHVASTTGTAERNIRDWFDRHLITPDGRRDQVMKRQDLSEGLPNSTIDHLIDTHLVRAEPRGGATWFELAHDRLIEPVRSNNQAWGDATLTPFQRQAALWDQQGRPDGLLARGRVLAQGVALSRRPETHFTRAEEDFLRRCRREARRSFAISALLVVALVAATLLGVAGWEAYTQRVEAEQQAQNAFARQLAAEGLLASTTNPRRSLLLGVEASRVAAATPRQEAAPSAEESLRAALASIGGIPLRGHASKITTLAVNPTRRLIATGDEASFVRLWQADSLDTPLAVLRGHSATIGALAFSADGNWLASLGSDEGRILLWRVDALDQPPAELWGHRLGIAHVVFSPDGRWLATAGDDGAANLWRIGPPPELVAQLTTSATSIRSLAFDPESTVLATGSHEGELSLWSLDAPATPTIQRTIAAFPLTSLAWSPDGETVAIAAATSLFLFEPRQPEAKLTLIGAHPGGVSAIVFSPDSVTLASGGGDGIARLWVVDQPAPAPVELQGHTGALSSLAFSSNGTSLATGGADGIARIWAPHAPGTPAVELRGHEGSINALGFIDDERLVTVSADTTGRLWRVGSPVASPAILDDHRSEVLLLATSGDGRWLATGATKGDILVYTLDNPAASPIALEGPNGSPSTTLAFSSDGRWLAAGYANGAIRLWAANADFAPVHDPPWHASQVITLAFSPDSQWLASGSFDAKALLWRVGAPQADYHEVSHAGFVNAVAFSPDSSLLATGGADKKVYLHEVASGIPATNPLVAHTDEIKSLAFVANTLLASGGADKTVRLWQVDDSALAPQTLTLELSSVDALAVARNGQLLAAGGNGGELVLWQPGTDPAEALHLTGESVKLNALAFTADGEHLITAGSDQRIILWRSQPPLSSPVVLRGHKAAVYRVTVTAEDKHIVSTSYDGTTRVWPLDTATLPALACATAGRNLSPIEWAQSFTQQYAKTCPQLPRHPDFYQGLLREGKVDTLLRLYAIDQEADPTLESPVGLLVERAAILLSNPENPSELALQLYARAIDLDPTLAAVTTNNFTIICINLEYRNPADALDPCERALARNKRHGNYHFNLARVRIHLGHAARAREHVEAFLIWVESTNRPNEHGNIELAQAWLVELEAGRLPNLDP